MEVLKRITKTNFYDELKKQVLKEQFNGSNGIHKDLEDHTFEHYEVYLKPEEVARLCVTTHKEIMVPLEETCGVNEADYKVSRTVGFLATKLKECKELEAKEWFSSIPSIRKSYEMDIASKYRKYPVVIRTSYPNEIMVSEYYIIDGAHNAIAATMVGYNKPIKALFARRIYCMTSPNDLFTLAMLKIRGFHKTQIKDT